MHLSCSVYIAVIIFSSKFCILTATCRLCSSEHHFLAIGRIAYITSCSCCETEGSVWVSHLSPYLHPVYIDLFIPSHSVMSMTSTVTASAVHYPTLGGAHDLANHICILVATWGDGTVFSNSFQEEDLIELCVGRARHTQIVCSRSQRPKHFLHSILPLKWQLPHVFWVQPWCGMMNLSDSIPNLPLTPISELMWLWGACTPPALKPFPSREVVSW